MVSSSSQTLTRREAQPLVLAELISEETARNFLVCVENYDGQKLEAVAATAFGETLLQKLFENMPLRITIRRDTPERIERLISVRYATPAGSEGPNNEARPLGARFERFTGRITPVTPPEAVRSIHSDGDLRQIVNLIFEEAVEADASDVRIVRNAEEQKLEVVFIVNDDQRTVHAWDCSEQAWKWFAMNLLRMANVRDEGLMSKQHSGQITTSVGNRRVEVRLMAIPVTNHAAQMEKTHLMFTLRIQCESGKRFDWERLGYLQWERDTLYGFGEKKGGLLLLIGQMGSGKNGTVCALLAEMLKRRPGRRILTIEKPIEVRIPGANQVEVPPDRTPEEYLTGALRSASEVIFCTETNSAEMANAVAQSALTGHLTITTLHAGNPFQVVRRLAGFGVNPMDVAESLSGVVYQTLAVNLCPHCRRPHHDWRERAPEDLLVVLRHWRIPTTLEEAYEFFLEKRGRDLWPRLSPAEQRRRLAEWDQSAWGVQQAYLGLARENAPNFEEWRAGEAGSNPYLFTPYESPGCERCAMSGEAGRSAIPEIFDPKPFRTLLSESQTTPTELRIAALRRGHVTLAKAGMARVINGTIGLSSYLRACGPLDLDYEGVSFDGEAGPAERFSPPSQRIRLQLQ
jgi:type II secretory ATPase GspE/PulE/Tfp pilus assembly ATPase PilB-like protein